MTAGCIRFGTEAVLGYEKAKGSIEHDNIDIYKEYGKVRSDMGFVPQQDLLRLEDTVYATLSNAAEMKMDSTTARQEREQRIDHVLNSLGLLRERDSIVRKLSGGQRKRLSIAVELVSDPGLFFLDEPDSGLDGIMAKSLMEQLRAIANEGKIVMVITRAPDRVSQLFDKVIVLAKGEKDNIGHLAFFGSVPETLDFFGTTSLEGVIKKINRVDEGGDGLSDYYIDISCENRYGYITFFYNITNKGRESRYIDFQSYGYIKGIDIRSTSKGKHDIDPGETASIGCTFDWDVISAAGFERINNVVFKMEVKENKDAKEYLDVFNQCTRLDEEKDTWIACAYDEIDNSDVEATGTQSYSFDQQNFSVRYAGYLNQYGYITYYFHVTNHGSLPLYCSFDKYQAVNGISISSTSKGNSTIMLQITKSRRIPASIDVGILSLEYNRSVNSVVLFIHQIHVMDRKSHIKTCDRKCKDRVTEETVIDQLEQSFDQKRQCLCIQGQQIELPECQLLVHKRTHDHIHKRHKHSAQQISRQREQIGK